MTSTLHNAAELKKKIIAGRRKRKQEFKEAHQSKNTRPKTLSSLDWIILVGTPLFCTFVIAFEAKCDFLVLFTLWMVDFLLGKFFYTPGIVEKLGYIMTNIMILINGEKILKYHLLYNLMRPRSWILLLCANILGLLSSWLLWIRHGRSKNEKMWRWDIISVAILIANTLVYVHIAGISFHELSHRATSLLRLFGN